MKFKVSLSEFQKVLQKVLPALPRKSTLPILEQLHFSVEDTNLKIIATDQEITIMANINIETEEKGSILVPGRKLNEFSKAAGLNGDIHFSSDDENYDIVLTTNNGKYKIKGMDPDEYLSIPELFESEKPDLEMVMNQSDVEQSPKAFLPKEEIMKLANKTYFAVSKDEYRPAMNGVLLQFRKDTINAVSTDSFRLVRTSSQSDKAVYPDNIDLILPVRAVEILRKVEEDIILSVIEKQSKITHVRMDIGETVIITRIIDEKFPPYETVIPQNNEIFVIVDIKDIMASMKRVTLFTNSKAPQVKMKLATNEMTLLAQNDEIGEDAVETFACEFDGEPYEIGFNSVYLEEMLQNSSLSDDDSRIKMTFSEPNRPVLLFPIEKENELLMLIMPVRV